MFGKAVNDQIGAKAERVSVRKNPDPREVSGMEFLALARRRRVRSKNGEGYWRFGNRHVGLMNSAAGAAAEMELKKKDSQ